MAKHHDVFIEIQRVDLKRATVKPRPLGGPWICFRSIYLFLIGTKKALAVEVNQMRR